jgi:DNA-binding IclR family transcriptional regulator
MGRSRSAKQLNYSIQSVVRGAKIVDAIAAAEKEIGAQQISTNLGLNISTVFRFLQTLSQCGLVEQDPETGKYGLGLKLLDWGMQVLRRMDLRRDALPFLRELNEKTLEMVHLTVYDRDAAIYIEKIESPTPLRVYSEVGKAAPLHCTGVGKVLMAALSEQELVELLKRYPLRRFTANTITDVAALKSELNRIRAQGFAMDNEEHEEHIRCVAAPIRNHTGRVVASISIAGPTTRVTRDRVPELVGAVKETAQKISTRFGYKGGSVLRQTHPSDRNSASDKSKSVDERKGRPKRQYQYAHN